MVREQVCQRALTERQTLGSGGALQRGHSASLERLAQRNDALSVGNELSIIVVVPTNTVATEPGGSKTQQCQWALTRKANTWGAGSRGGGLLQRAQRGVGLQPVSESDYSLGAEAVVPQTASTRAEAGDEACQGALTYRKANS